jgi:hypothetical protein
MTFEVRITVRLRADSASEALRDIEARLRRPAPLRRYDHDDGSMKLVEQTYDEAQIFLVEATVKEG